MTAVQRVAVVVPAKDEEAFLPSCLEALVAAARQVAVPVHIIVVLDSCQDRSDLAVLRQTRAAGDVEIRSVTVDASCVGSARARGMAEHLSRLPAESTWLATTDADSTVPLHWLTTQLDRAAAGFDVVVGTVAVADWSEHSAAVRDLAVADYAARPHRHVHGTNLGFAATAYLTAGGFQPIPTDEDVTLVTAFDAAGERIAWVDDAPVVTSARRTARAPRGFAGYLIDLGHPRAGADSASRGTHGRRAQRAR